MILSIADNFPQHDNYWFRSHCNIIYNYTECPMRRWFCANDTTYHPKALKAPSTSIYASYTHLLGIPILLNPNPYVFFPVQYASFVFIHFVVLLPSFVIFACLFHGLLRAHMLKHRKVPFYNYLDTV